MPRAYSGPWPHGSRSMKGRSSNSGSGGHFWPDRHSVCRVPGTATASAEECVDCLGRIRAVSFTGRGLCPGVIFIFKLFEITRVSRTRSWTTGVGARRTDFFDRGQQKLPHERYRRALEDLRPIRRGQLPDYLCNLLPNPDSHADVAVLDRTRVRRHCRNNQRFGCMHDSHKAMVTGIGPERRRLRDGVLNIGDTHRNALLILIFTADAVTIRSRTTGLCSLRFYCDYAASLFH